MQKVRELVRLANCSGALDDHRKAAEIAGLEGRTDVHSDWKGHCCSLGGEVWVLSGPHRASREIDFGWTARRTEWA